jgi:hypothetical protein
VRCPDLWDVWWIDGPWPTVYEINWEHTEDNGDKSLLPEVVPCMGGPSQLDVHALNAVWMSPRGFEAGSD